MTAERTSYLPHGLARPTPMPDGLDTPYWEGTRRHELWVQRCRACAGWQWGPEWICHRCRSFDLEWAQVPPRARIYSFERVWHPVHPALAEGVPYIIVLVEYPDHDGIRMVGNLLGDPEQPVPIGASVEAVFEDHEDGDPRYTLVHWRVAG
jgi:uncharacterized OB-fold protein